MTVYTVPTNTILGENYKITQIESSNYNPQIDTDITITITITDVYGDALTNEPTTITCTSGIFTEVNGTTITETTNVTANTGAGGIITLTYHCNAWGNINIRSGENSIALNVEGWRYLYGTSSSSYRVMRNKNQGRLILSGWSGVQATTDWNTFGGENYAANCAPTAHTLGLDSTLTVFRVHPNGQIQYRTISGTVSSTTGHYMDFTWSVE